MADEEKSTGFLSKQFFETVNMSVKELEKWLADPKSTEAGKADSDGHKSGKKTVELLNKKEAEFGEEDFKHMRAVLAYYKKHKAGGPEKDVEDSKWRHSLMNWGHDPLKVSRERSRSPTKRTAKAAPEGSPEPKKAAAAPPSNGKAASPAKTRAKTKSPSPKRGASPAKAHANGNSAK